MTMDVLKIHPVKNNDDFGDWYNYFEVILACRFCTKTSTYTWRPFQNITPDYIDHLEITHSDITAELEINSQEKEKSIDLKQTPTATPPEIEVIYNEGVTCLLAECFNAAGAMFRATLEMTSKRIDEHNPDVTKTQLSQPLVKRLRRQIQSGQFPEGLSALADCIRLDGNDGIHDVNLTENDAYSLADFTHLLLGQIYTTPYKIELADRRRAERRASKRGTSQPKNDFDIDEEIPF